MRRGSSGRSLVPCWERVGGTLVGWPVLVWLLAGCAQTPTPVFISEADATQTALPPATVAPDVEPARLQVWMVEPGDDFEEVSEALIFEPLLGYGMTGELLPLLAAELPEAGPDGLSWSIRLLDGVLLQDGTPCDAVQVASALQAILTQESEDVPLAISAFQTLVDRIEPQDHGLTIYLKQPFAEFPALLASQSLAIIGPNGSGTGPFVQTSAGQMGATFDAFASYHGGPPALPGIDFMWGELSALQNELVEGTGLPDLVLGSEATSLGNLYQPWPVLGANRGLLLRRQISPLDTAGVMDALVLAATDPVEAREELAAAGLPDGFDMQVWTTERTEAIGGSLSGNLGELPVSLSVQAMPESSLVRTLRDPAAAGSAIAGIDVSWTRSWERDWWEWVSAGLVMQEQAIAMPVLIGMRSNLTDLEMTSGGWPRITGRTSLLPSPWKPG